MTNHTSGNDKAMVCASCGNVVLAHESYMVNPDEIRHVDCKHTVLTDMVATESETPPQPLKSAHSEPPINTIEEILTKLARWATDLIELPLHQYPDATLDTEQATQAISTLITQARINELERLKKIDAFNEAYTLDPRPAKLVSIRIKELKEKE